MLSETEKAYLEALDALKRKNYPEAVKRFEMAAQKFGTNEELDLLYQSIRLLLEVKKELSANGPTLFEEKELMING